MVDKIKKESLHVSAKSDFSGYVDGVKSAEKANEALVDSIEKVEIVQEKTERKLSTGGRGFQTLERRYDSLGAAQRRLQDDLEKLEGMRTRGLGDAEYNRILTGINSRMTELSTSAGGVAQGIAKTGRALQTSRRAMEVYGDSTRLTRMQLLTMQYTFNDVIASLASGASPFTILMQQGGQVTQAFGGLGATLKALVTPARVLKAGILGTAAAIGYAAIQADTFDTKLNTLDGVINAVGKGANLSRNAVKYLAEEIRNVSGVSRAESLDVVANLAKSPTIAVADYEDLIRLSREYAAWTGVEVPKALEALTSGFNDVSGFANTLNKQLDFLTVGEYNHIKSLQEHDKQTEATGILIDKLSGKLDGLADKSVSNLDKALNNLGKAYDNLKTKLLDSAWLRTVSDGFASLINLLTHPFVGNQGFETLPIEDKIDNITSRIENTRKALAANPNSFSTQGLKDQLSGLTGQLEVLQAQREEVAKVRKELEAPQAGRTTPLDLSSATKNTEKTVSERERVIQSIEDHIDSIKRETEAMKLSDSERTIQNELFRAEVQLRKLSKEESARYLGDLERELRKRALLSEEIKRQDTFQKMLNDKIEGIGKTLTDSIMSGASALSVFQQMFEDVLSELGRKAIINVLINPIVKQAGDALAGSAFSSIFSSIFGGFNATGGTVYPGHAYTVGENGRETFIPSTAGRVVPNEATQGRGVEQNFNFNVTVSGSAASSPANATKAGEAFAVAAKAKIIEIIQQEKQPGGSLWSPA